VGKAMSYGTIPNTTAALEKLVQRLRTAGSGALKFCYEAGPCGYGVHRTPSPGWVVCAGMTFGLYTSPATTSAALSTRRTAPYCENP
jgi:hypothetical protein